MPDKANPYIPGQPVDNPKLFFGRRELLASVRESLVKGRRVFAIYGAPRMGKSSALRQLTRNLPEGFVSVRVDLFEENAQQLDWLLWRLADAIDHQVGQQLNLDEPGASWAEFEGYTGFLVDHYWPKVRAALKNRSLFLLLDDLHSLAETENDLLSRFITVLGNWRDRDERLAIALTLDGGQQDILPREHPRLFGGAMSYILGPLASEEATRLITWPADGVLTYDYGVARRVIEASSGHPYYLQLLCFEVFNRCSTAGWVNQRDVDLVVDDLVSREIADFRQLWDESSPQEQAVLAALVSLRGARGVATDQEVRTILNKAGARVGREPVLAALESLTVRGILERLGALTYRFRVALLRDWLCERVDLQEVVRDTRWNAPTKTSESRRAGVLALSAGREHSRRSTSYRRRESEAVEGDEEEDGGVGGRSRWWIAAVAVLALVVVGSVLVPRLLAPVSPEPTVTRAAVSSPAAVLPTVTLTDAVELVTAEATETATAVLPTLTPTPTALPPLTPSPTPPIVVARSMPSVAYQSRKAGEQTWFVQAMNSDGSNQVRLAEGQSSFLSAPTWKPGGAQIAFVSDRSGNPEIWVMSADGEDLLNVTNHEAKDHSPAWSPDGEWIAFGSVRDAAYWELYIMRSDGSDLRRLTWWEDASDLYPTWSPDSTRIAFASKRDGNWEIYTMDRDGSNLMRLTNNEADDTTPAWSPDGSRIAFASTRDGYAEIYVMPVVGGEAVNVSNAPFSSEHGPTWSPDGGRIAFYSDRDGEWDIYVMASDGSDVIKLTGEGSNDQVPSWRP